MKKRLAESMEMQVFATVANLDILYSNMVAGWRGIPYAELSTLLGYAMFLQQVHHNHHWISQGDPFYGDHQLFDQLYSSVNGEVDGIAEKAVGLGNQSNVDLFTLYQQVNRWVATMYTGGGTIPSSSELARRSLDCEMAFLKFSALTSHLMESQGTLTRGLDNMLQGLEDTHEGHVYLLKQRIVAGGSVA